MSPKYMIVLLVALVLVATSLAGQPEKPPQPHPPTLQEQQLTPHLDSTHLPPHKRIPPRETTTKEQPSKEKKGHPHPGHDAGVEPNTDRKLPRGPPN